MTKKIIRREVSISSQLQNLHPLLQRIYDARGIKTDQELDLNLERLLPYHSLLDIDKAVLCLAKAITQDEKILIVGDFDADGATSTAVAIRALKSFGAKKINYLVPNRFEFGYGLTPELVLVAEKNFQPHVIVTVDNGIANHSGVLAAKELGIKVVITDHHLAAETLPEADATVNPNQPGDPFLSKNIAGVGVIFYVMLALRRYLSEQGWFESQNLPQPNMSHLLDLVALGTVADVVALDQNNRIMVHHGVRLIRAGKCVPGIIALLEISARNFLRLQTADLGFAVAPRLNAAGRLDDMSLGIECLLTNDLSQAREMAQVLNQLNDERRSIEQDMQEQALHALKKIPTHNTTKHEGICLFDSNWHQGVIGILAGRIKDRFHRPVIAFALANENEIKGSARSIPGLHIRDVLADISVKHPNLIIKFGGHAMAAGLTLAREAFESFKDAFNEIVAAQLNKLNLQNAIWSDGELEPEEISLVTAELIRESGPWGQSFPEPVFDGEFQILDQRLVGNKHLKLILAQKQNQFNAIAFNIDINQWPNYRLDSMKIAYKLDINEFRGKRSVQLIIEHIEI